MLTIIKRKIKKLFRIKEPIIPLDAHSLEVFAIKDCVDSPTGKQAFIGFKITNDNFYFVGVPYTENKYEKIDD